MGKPYVRQVEVIGLVEQLGTVLLFDDIEDLLKWMGYGTGTDWVVEKSTTEAFSGSASLHLKTRITTPAAGDYVAATRRFALSIGKKLSVELRLRYVSKALVDRIMIGFGHYDGAMYRRGWIGFYPPEGKWMYFTSGGVMEDIPGAVQRLHEDGWHRVKLVMDFEKSEYVSFQCNELVIDMTGKPIRVTPDTRDSFTMVVIEVWTETAAQAESYFDDILCKEE